MGKTILTPAQSFVLESVAEDKEIADLFFLSGGTALSEFYLHHRLSEDLDFFSSEEFGYSIIERLIKKISSHYKAKSEKKTRTGFYRCTLIGTFGILKIDFMHQIFKQLESNKKSGDLQIASLWDIVVDKLYTIFHRATARDFVDLYFGIKETGCNLDQLRQALEEKYQTKFNKMALLSRFPIVKDLSDFPKMLVPFDRKKMEDFFLKQVKKMEGEIFE